MEKYRAIPEGYMTVGEVAKKMGVTVRTLQYYDKENLLKPSAESDGGRRLYTDKDLIKLHQILSLKSLGFSLEDISRRLIPLDNPADVAAALNEQALAIRQKIAALSESLSDIERLQSEVLQMKKVDFKKYADIIVNLQMKNEYYFLIKKFDDNTMDYIRSRFDKESGMAFMNKFSMLSREITELAVQKVPYEEERSQKAVAQFWEMVMEFTDGDMSMLPTLMSFGDVSGTAESDEWEKQQALVNSYVGPALELYFAKMGVNPFPEES